MEVHILNKKEAVKVIREEMKKTMDFTKRLTVGWAH